MLVVCTNGDKGTSDRTIEPATLAKIREKEQLDAAKVLNISEVVFLRFPDQNLEDCVEFRKALVKQIRKHQPDLVVTIDPNRPYIRHRDHYMTGRVTLDAVFPYARDHLAFPDLLDEGLEPFKVQEVWLFRSEVPIHYIDITDTFEKKMDSLYCHVSQMSRPKEEASASQSGPLEACGIQELTLALRPLEVRTRRVLQADNPLALVRLHLFDLGQFPGAA